MASTGQYTYSEIKKRFSDILIFLFVFLLPTQLGKHFFLPFSYVTGVRVDYLAPTLYVTDILCLLLILTHIKEYRLLLRNMTIQYALFMISLTLFFALSLDFGLYKFIKTIELIAVAAIFSSTNTHKRTVFFALFWASLLQLYVASLQLTMAHSLNGDFYFLGERPLTLSMPGIAKAAIDGVEILRPYGTFSHPNSMAGFFLVLYSYYLFHKPHVHSFVYRLFIVTCAILTIISFSKVAITTFFLTTMYYLYRQKKLGSNARLRAVVVIVIGFTCALFFRASTDPLTIAKRIALVSDSFHIIAAYPITGVGPGNYLYAQAEFPQKYASFILQPVHNIVLLTIAELGIPIGLFVMYHVIRFAWKRKHVALPIICIAATGMFDHYWLTLQQNWLLLGGIWGLTMSTGVFEHSPHSAEEIS